jgi:hypothetical protein
MPLTIFWSNSKIPTKEFIILDHNSLRWLVKPDKEDGALATAIGVSPLYRDKVDFYVLTLVKANILIPEAISVIHIP